MVKRIFEHKEKYMDGFTKKYEINKLVYYEIFKEIEFAFNREKQIKKWKRDYKIDLIKKQNPNFDDLYFSICQ